MVGHPPALAIGDVRERDQRSCVRDGVGLLHRVADCVDIGIARLVRVVDRQATAGSQLEPGGLGDPHVGSHADRADDEIGREHLSVAERDSALVDRHNCRAGRDAHAVGDELVGDEDRELGIERRQHLRSCLHEADVEALLDEVLGHLEADEPGTDHDRGRGRVADVRREPGRVLDGPERPDPVVAGDRGPHGCGAHAEHELVVGDERLGTGERRACGDGVGAAVDGDDFVVHPDIEPEAVEQLLRGLEGEVLLFLDQSTDEVGQAAVREGDVARPLEHRDLGVGVEAAEAGRGRHPPGDPTDDHDAHRRPPGSPSSSRASSEVRRPSRNASRSGQISRSATTAISKRPAYDIAPTPMDTFELSGTRGMTLSTRGGEVQVRRRSRHVRDVGVQEPLARHEAHERLLQPHEAEECPCAGARLPLPDDGVGGDGVEPAAGIGLADRERHDHGCVDVPTCRTGSPPRGAIPAPAFADRVPRRARRDAAAARESRPPPLRGARRSPWRRVRGRRASRRRAACRVPPHVDWGRSAG